MLNEPEMQLDFDVSHAITTVFKMGLTMKRANFNKLQASLVLLIGVILTCFLYNEALKVEYELQQKKFDFRAHIIKERAEQRLVAYANLLYGARGLFNSSISVTREEFYEYATAANLKNNYSGIQGLGFSLAIPPHLKSSHIESIRKEGFPGYTVHPEGQRDLYTAIIYLEPFTPRNQLAFGYDMYSEGVRRTAMEQARDRDEAVMSGKVTLVQENESLIQAGFLMYVPIYRAGLPHKTLSDRRANIIGWVYSPFRMNNLMNGILGEEFDQVDYTLYDGDNETLETAMYDNDNHLLAANFQDQSLFHNIQQVKGMGRVWTLRLRSLPAFEADNDTSGATIILITGILLSVLLSMLIWQLTGRREQAMRLAKRMTSKLRDSEASLIESQRIASLGNYAIDMPSGSWTSSEVLDQLLGIDNTFVRSMERWESLIHPEDRDQADRRFKKTLHAKKELFEREYRIIRHDNQEERWMHESAKLKYDDDENVVSILGTIQDITERKIVEQALQESEEKYRRLFDLSEDPMWLISDGCFVMANLAAAQLMGYETNEALINRRPHELSPEFQQDGKRSDDEAIAMMSIADRKGYHRFEWTHKKKSGEEFIVEVSLTRIPYGRGHALFCIWRDITERKEIEANLIKLLLAVEQSPSSVVITDLDSRIEYVNQTFVHTTGYSKEDVIGQNPRILQSGKTPKLTYEEIWAHLVKGEPWHGELINQRKDGSHFTELVTISPVRQPDGKITNYLAVKQDISEHKQAEERIERLAHFDQLTGLPNRVTLNDRFRYASAQARRKGQSLAVIFLDLDHFKNINDTLGHSAGDLLLIEIGKRLKECVREEDTVSRTGGDEFILILPDTDANGAIAVVSKLMVEISRPVHTNQHELTTTGSIGISMYPRDGDNFEVLSQAADAAMYRAKQEGRNNFRFFTPELQESAARILQLSNFLRHALENNELSLHYQPQISIQNGHILGMEALLRWEHPELGMIPPAEFIPIAEINGLIVPIGEWVIRTAARQLKDWMDNGLPPMIVAVNMSAVQFRQANITEVIARILDEEQLLPEYLEIELTETVAMSHPVKVISMMNKLHSLGIRMSVDDFGTGYSSLNYLKAFKVYKLKIDQSFVRDIASNPDDKAISTAIINIAHNLGMLVIAEGVETAEQLACLRLMGCDEAQGYYFSKPLPADQFFRIVNNTETLLPTF
ncbi:bifunctional diguanylate cyclase/phosphodiesterase [Porticoccus sp.]